MIGLVVTAATADPGVVLVVDEPLTPLQFPLAAGIPYKFSYPDTRVGLWTSPAAFAGTEIPADTVLVSGQGVYGDANGDGLVRLDDLVTIRNDRGTSVSTSDLDRNGTVEDADLVACRNVLGNGGSVLTVYAQGLTASAALDDVAVELLTDPDEDEVFTVVDVREFTVLEVMVNPTSGLIGTALTVTINPAIAPLAFDSETTATWSGVLVPPRIPRTHHMMVEYAASQVHEQSAGQAAFVVGDGTMAPESSIGESTLDGVIDGKATLHLGSTDVTKSFQFTVEAQFGFVSGGGGVGGPVSFLQVLDPGNPAWGSLTLEECYAAQYVAVVLADKNTLSEALAPSMLPANIVTFDELGIELDRVTVWMFLAGRDDFGPDYLVYYSNWEEPVVFVDTYVNPAMHPTLTVVRADPNGSWDLRIR